MAGLEAERVRASLKSKLFGAAARPLQIGRFEVLSKVAEGGMGVVYRARDPALERTVALKLLHPGGESVQLLAEARAMARLDHPNVVGVFEVGTSGPDGRVFIAMEYVEGTTLEGWLRARPRSASEIADAFASAARGLAAAHRVALVHRDFKPQNVLVSRTGELRVADFGLARATVADGDAGAASGRAPLSRPQLAGTPLYMAPELFNGASPDAKTDQFSFSVALFEALFEKKPFPATTFEELRAAQARGLVVPTRRDVPRWLRQAVVRGLSHDPALRFPSMDAVADALAHTPAKLGWMYGAIALAAAASVIAYVEPWSGVDPSRSARSSTSVPAPSDAASNAIPPSAAPATTDLPPPPVVEWQRRTVPAYTLERLKERLEKNGYGVRRADDGTSATFKLFYLTVSKAPCGGGVNYSEYPDPKQAEHSRAAMTAYGGSRVLRSDNRVLQITLSRAVSPEGDPACTDPLAVLLTD